MIPSGSGENTVHQILVVDDEEIVLVALRETLQREGYQVVTCSNAIEALQVLKEQPFSVIITDQQMPLLTGLEFLAQVKQIQPDATRILITAVLSLGTVIDAINKGEIYRFVVKPWLREELLATVRNAVQRYELICKNLVLQATTLSMNDRLKKVNAQLEEQVAKVAEQNTQLESLNAALQQNLQHSVELCLKTMETFYPTLGSQARRVFELCRAMALELKIPEKDRQVLEIAAWLHDVGLVGVPRHLIKRMESQPETLSQAEWSLIKQHPIIGQELASFVQELQEVGVVIRAHHERFDGRGYPDGLSGDRIPPMARLLAVAVAYGEIPHEPVIAAETISRGSGSAYEPDAVRALVRCLPHAMVPRRQREVLLTELSPGMVLAKGIYTNTGMLLIPGGQKLTETYIDKIINHHRISPIAQSLLVYC
jgi:response regulator RpfG family c-di-GMP phosphodiesterase